MKKIKLIANSNRLKLLIKVFFVFVAFTPVTRFVS